MHRNYLAKAIFKYFEEKYGNGKSARTEGWTSGRILFFEQEVVFQGTKLRLCLVKHETTRILTIFNDSLRTDYSQGKIFSVMSCLCPNRAEIQYFGQDCPCGEELVSEIHKLLDRKDLKLKALWPKKETNMLKVA